MLRYLIIAKGRVQGVGFRYFAELTAYKLNLTGWCKNLMDGSVEIEIQGLEKNVLSFISAIKSGNNFSRIEDLDLSSIDLIENEKKFRIKY
ncbi:acylphosphatase [Clostridium sp. BL-8]|uniref:acylphosphatase n=1 Tax=Clostridium sp. BL-8 TaxID=349938 RepID=UPI00098C18BE|nr:acylphosphatase [Clostridium sp. BL-8]OOM79908.1 acylphosphatase [Clostridium sp. BL-8]